MNTGAMRRTGLEIVGDVPWGTHFCLFYHITDDLIDILVPYFKAGLENNEFCMWVTSEPLSVDDATRALMEAVKEFDTYSKKGQIEILDYSEWYTQSGKFEADTVLQGWVEKERLALKNGFDGLRLTGNTFWLEKSDWKAFTEYEATVDSVIGNYRMIALCSYSLDTCKAAEVIDVVKNHRFALIRRAGTWEELIESAERKQAEETLRLHREIMTNMVEGVVLTKVSDGTIVYTNSKFEEMFGYGPGELVGKNISVVNAPTEKSPEAVAEDIQCVLKETGVWSGDVYTIKKDSTPFWCSANVSTFDHPVYGNVWVAVHTDITERKQAEDKVRESEKEHQTILDSVPVGIFHMDANSTFIHVNKALAERYGLTPGDFNGKTSKELFPDMGEKYIESDQEVLERGEPQTGVATKIKTPEGVRWVRLDKVPIKDVAGNVTNIVGFELDITERIRTQEALLASEKHLRETKDHLDNVINSSADAIVVVDMEGIVRDWNRGAEDYMGYTADEVIGTPNKKFFADPEEAGKIMEMVLRAGALKNYRTIVLTKEKKTVDISISAALLRDREGVPIGTVRVSRDITKEVELEERIKEERDKLNSIFETMTDGVYVVSPDYEVQFMNKVMIDDFGDCFGSMCYNVFHDREEPCPLCKCSEVMEGRTERWEWHSRRMNKTYDLIETPLRNVDGTLSKLTIFRDITDRKQVELGLQESRQRLEDIIEFLPDATFVIDLAGTVIAWNQAMEAMTGIRASDIVGKGDYEYALPFYGERRPLLLDLALKPDAEMEKNYASIKREGNALITHVHFPALIGREAYLWGKATPLYDLDGTVAGAIESIRDITEQKKVEAALRESETKFKGLAERSRDIIFVTDSEGVLIYVSPFVKKMLGFTPDEFSGKPFSQFLIPSEVPQAMSRFNEVLKYHHNIEDLSVKLKGKTGKIIYGEVRASPVILNNRAVGTQGIIRDITERKRAEEEIKKLSQFRESIIDNANVWLNVLDVNANVLIWNKAAEVISGYSRDEVVGHGKIWEWLYPDEAYRKEIATKAEAIIKGDVVENLETTIRCKDGQVRIIAWHSRNLTDEKGASIGSIALGRDITERKRVEAALRESEEKYRYLFESSAVGISITDVEGTILDVNEAMCRIMGYPYDEVLTVKVLDTYANPEDRKVLLNHIKEEGFVEDFEVQLKNKKGEIYWASLSVRPVTFRGNDALLTSVIDITERRRADEELLQAYGGIVQRQEAVMNLTEDLKTEIVEHQRAKEQITASLKEKETLLKEIHHRVKNNLQIISSLFNLQARKLKSGQALEIIKDSQSRVKSMALVHEKLYQSKDLTRIDFAEYVRSLTTHLLRIYRVGPATITLKLNIKDVLLDINAAIPCGLIINELVSNSLKHAFPDGREGEIQIALHPITENQIELIVSDDGIGFPKDRDFRNTDSLGLQLVCILVDQLGGTIELDRSEGTTFTIKATKERSR